MRGLYLQGGGAKGAFQAGVIYGLYERGLDFNILCGTSIGAVNSYFIYTGNVEKLKEVWENIDINDLNDYIKGDIVIENKYFIEILKKLEGKNNEIKSAYVNYVKVNATELEEIVVDLEKISKKEDRLKAIKYSSLIPYEIRDDKSLDELIEEFDSKRVFDEFKENLGKGIYDGYCLDGGILNNDFLQPFINDRVNEIFAITFKKEYEIPEYILNKYKRQNIYLFQPETEMKPNDTLRFKREFCRKLFHEGYEVCKKIVKNKDF